MQWNQRCSFAALLVCACSGPSVEGSSPSTGPYGTTVTIRGDRLDFDGGRILFENGVVVRRDSPLVKSWDDSQVVFRVPTPAAGAFMLDGNGPALDAGVFVPDPWRPSALSIDDEQQRRLAWTKPDADTIVEVIRAAGSLEIHFVDADGNRTFQSLSVDAGSAELVPTGPDAVEGYFFDASRAELGWFTASRGDAQFLVEDVSSDVDTLLAVDRDEQGSYAWLSNTDDHELVKWRVADGALVETQVIDDVADTSNERRLAAARGQHLWRVWVSNQYTLLDDYFEVMGAYLSPGASVFSPAIQLSSADDGASLLATHGVTGDGLVAVEFCGTDVDPIESTKKTCGSVVASATGVVHKAQDARSTERTLYYAFDDGVAALECVDGVHELDRFESAVAAPDPVFAPCAVQAPRHVLDASGAPSFESSTGSAAVVLSRE